MIDLSRYRVVDGHCHAFLPEKETDALDQAFNISTLQIPTLHSENTLTFRRAVKDLAVVLGCRPDFETVVKTRNERYFGDPQGYVLQLFQAGGIDTLVVDIGYPCEEFTGYSVPLDKFCELTQCKTKAIYRLEPLMARLFSQSLPFSELEQEFEKSLEEAIRVEKCVGFKSIIAYVFGLRVKVLNTKTAAVAYERARKAKLLTVPLTEKNMAALADEKVVRDYLLCRALEKSIELKVPFQIHTGIGDSPFIDLRDGNPLHLFEVITDNRLKDAEIVLLHAGYPFIRESGYLANQYPNVYVGLSEMIPHTGIGMESSVLQVLEMCPVTKVMYGSDGAVPEVYWLAATWGKESIARALQKLVETKVVDEAYAYEAGRLILSENAIRFYKLNK